MAYTDTDRTRRVKRINVRPSGPPKQQETKYGVYPAYFFREHDPILDQVDTLIEKSGMKMQAVANASHVSPSTLKHWHDRQTKRPQFATVKAVVNSLGGQLVIVYRGRKIGQ